MKMQRNILSLLAAALLSWLPLVFAITCLAGLAYLVGQQGYRQSANDPQIQIAEDAARALEKGANPVAVVPDGTIELSESLAPFIMVFDVQGDLVVGNGVLDGAPPTFPRGLLDEKTWIEHKTEHIRGGTEARVTWQPREGVRQALVIVHSANGSYIVAGRSLRPTEERVNDLTMNVFLAWMVTMAGSLVLSLVASALRERRNGLSENKA